ncbi:NAD(P)-dependent alcohol dehydrogenase [candidate division KSB1 bacterium]
MHIDCYAALDKGKYLKKYRYESKPLNNWEIEVEISHCGICHSDIHLIDDDWDISSYPLVPGHEIIGFVKKKGKNVNVLKINDRVGIGWQSSACFSCESCIRGLDNLCSQQKATCVDGHGGFARSIIIDSRYAFRIPENLRSGNAAPLLCGGITVYSPLRFYNVSPPMKVGVIGIGGLGHLAIQFAAAFGCEVTAFSTTPEKQEEAVKFGAKNFISGKDHKVLRKSVNSLDFIISTVFSDLDWNRYLSILRPAGKLCFVGAPTNSISIPAHQLIVSRKSVCGSNIGSRHQIEEMLRFADRHNITAQTEVVPMSEVNTAIEKVRNNKARYRIVLKN